MYGQTTSTTNDRSASNRIGWPAHALTLAIAFGIAASPALAASADDGQLVIWGPVPDAPPGLLYHAASAAIPYPYDWWYGLALLSDGTLADWGTSSQMPPLPQGLSYTAVAVSETTQYALRSDGELVSGGWNPVPAPALPRGVVYTAVATDGQDLLVPPTPWNRTIALRSDGSAVVWGQADDSRVFEYVLSPSDPEVSFIAVAAGLQRTLLLQSDGLLFGDGVDELPPGATYTAVAVGWHHSLALRSDGHIVSWNNAGQLQVLAPPAGLTYTAIAAGWGHSLALRSDGEIVDGGGYLYPPAPEGHRYTRIFGGKSDALSMAIAAPISTHPADLNGDGVVDGADLGLLLNNWGNDGVGDLNGDGIVDGADLGLLLNNWG